MFNTLIKYSEIPDENDFSVNEKKRVLRCTDPTIYYNRISKILCIFGKDVNLELRAKSVSVEQL